MDKTYDPILGEVQRIITASIQSTGLIFVWITAYNAGSPRFKENELKEVQRRAARTIRGMKKWTQVERGYDCPYKHSSKMKQRG